MKTERERSFCVVPKFLFKERGKDSVFKAGCKLAHFQPSESQPLFKVLSSH